MSHKFLMSIINIFLIIGCIFIVSLIGHAFNKHGSPVTDPFALGSVCFAVVGFILILLIIKYE